MKNIWKDMNKLMWETFFFHAIKLLCSYSNQSGFYVDYITFVYKVCNNKCFCMLHVTVAMQHTLSGDM